MRKIKIYFFVGCLLIALILVRVFQDTLFYDPLIDYFKVNYINSAVPEINIVKYLIHILFRYFLNMLLSLGIIYLIFKNFKTLLFSIKFYMLLFIVLAVFLVLELNFNLLNGKMFLFYIRRFLIQPIFLFILVPAFYYQKLKKKSIQL